MCKVEGIRYVPSGFVTGFIDLVFRWDNKYYPLDWKSNYLESGYDSVSVERNMRERGYVLQYKIYISIYSNVNKFLDLNLDLPNKKITNTYQNKPYNLNHE